MKKHLRYSFLLILLGCMLVKELPARTAPPSANPELVLGIPMLTNKDYDNVKNLLMHTNGITLQGFCTQYNCFLMTYDPSQFKSGDAIATMVETAYPMYKTEIKYGATIARLIDDCNKFPVQTTTGTER